MNKLKLNKTLAAGIFAATIITITACGGSGGGSSASGSTKISTIAGGGDSTTATDATQATLGAIFNLVAKDNRLLFNSVGITKQRALDLATNQLSAKDYSGINARENVSSLLTSSSAKYYLWTFKSFGGYALYEVDSELHATHIAGKNDVSANNFIANENGKSASFRDPSYQAVLYNDGTNDQLFFIDDSKIRKVTLSGSYPTTTVNDSPKYNPGSIALSGEKLIVTDSSKPLIFEHALNDGAEAIVAGSSQGYENAENPLQAMLKTPSYIAISPSGNIYFSDSGVADGNQRIIRKLAVNNGVYGAVTTAFGAAPGGTADSAELNIIYDLEFVGNNLFVIDTGADKKDRIKKIEFINQTP